MISMKGNNKRIYLSESSFNRFKSIIERSNNLSKGNVNEAFYDGDEYMDDDEMPQDEGQMGSVKMDGDIINQIRTLALQGIQQYSEDVDSEEYDFYKKVWLMCDKTMSQKDSVKNREE